MLTETIAPQPTKQTKIRQLPEEYYLNDFSPFKLSNHMLAHHREAIKLRQK
jgi:hypothetical protein